MTAQDEQMLTKHAAQWLAKLPRHQRKDVKAVCRLMRKELGLGEHPGLRA